MTIHKDNFQEFIDECDIHDFTPCAYYDKHLDCIRVRISDCSIRETQKGKIFTVLKAAHTGRLAGFTIKGIRHLFEELGLKDNTTYRLAKIMDEIVKQIPQQLCDEVMKIFDQKVKKDELKVEVVFEQPLAA